MAKFESLKVGTRVKLVMHGPGEGGALATVRILNEPGSEETLAGHFVGVELDEHFPQAQLNGLYPVTDKKGNVLRDETDPQKRVIPTVPWGHGWWTRPEYVEIID